MTRTFSFAFVESTDPDRLEKAIVIINRSRQHPVPCKRVIRTAPRRGWMAIILDCDDPDHYLLRNLSGRLQTTTFELGIKGARFYYRLHRDGETRHAHESQPAQWIEQQLGELLSTNSITQLDLGEPAGRFILRCYHDYQRTRGWSAALIHQQLPDELMTYYHGEITDLEPLLIPGVDRDNLARIFAPDVSASAALDRLAVCLDLPYLIGDRVEVALKNHMQSSARHDPNRNNRQVVTGYDILKPATWPDGGNLPSGWSVLLSDSWQIQD